MSPEVESAARELLVAAHRYWKVANREMNLGAVVWLDYDGEPYACNDCGGMLRCKPDCSIAELIRELDELEAP